MTPPLFVGIRGCVLALERGTGTEIWRTYVKGADFVNVVVDGGELLAATKGRLYCLDQATGTIRWENPLSGLGWGIVSIAGAPITPAAQRLRQEREQDAAGAAVAGMAGT